eukprot:4770602-Pleurochrysis_carterae.AAC.2
MRCRESEGGGSLQGCGDGVGCESGMAVVGTHLAAHSRAFGLGESGRRSLNALVTSRAEARPQFSVKAAQGVQRSVQDLYECTLSARRSLVF